ARRFLLERFMVRHRLGLGLLDDLAFDEETTAFEQVVERRVVINVVVEVLCETPRVHGLMARLAGLPLVVKQVAGPLRPVDTCDWHQIDSRSVAVLDGYAAAVLRDLAMVAATFLA